MKRLIMITWTVRPRVFASSGGHRPQGGRGRPGAALVEMAVVLPLFITIILGIIELGRALMVGQVMTNAAREGARLAVITGTTNAEVQTVINDYLSSAGITGASIAITDENGTAIDLASATSGQLVRIAVSIPFADASWLPPTFLAGRDINGLAVMRHE